MRAFDAQHAVGLTGTDGAIESIAKRYRVAYQMEKRDPSGAYDVTHSSAVYIFDSHGHARLLATESDSIDTITHDLRRVIDSTGFADVLSEFDKKFNATVNMSSILYWLDPWEPSPTVVIAVLIAAALFARGARKAAIRGASRCAECRLPREHRRLARSRSPHKSAAIALVRAGVSAGRAIVRG